MTVRRRLPKSLAAVLDASESLVALFDCERIVCYVNPACAAWAGVSPETLLGRKANYATLATSDALAFAMARLAPPLEAFEDSPAAVTVMLNTAANNGQQWQATYFPLAGSEYSVLLVATKAAADQSTGTPLECSSLDPHAWHLALIQSYSSSDENVRADFLLGSSSAMQRVRAQSAVASQNKAHVSIVGAMGTGTHELAQRIAAAGKSAITPLLSLDCHLQDAESIQGALRSVSKRRFDGDDRATLIFRDIHRLPPTAQQELWGFLQFPETEVRIVSTSRRALLRESRQGRFFEPLAAILSPLEVRLPLLRRRPLDIPLIAQALLEQQNAQRASPLSGFTPEAIEQLIAYPWPQNVAELRACARFACEAATGPWVRPGDLPENVRGAWRQLVHQSRAPEVIKLDSFLAEIEKELLARALGRAKGNKSEAARLLSISRTRLLRRLEQLGMTEKQSAAVTGSDGASGEPSEAIDFIPVDNAPPTDNRPPRGSTKS